MKKYISPLPVLLILAVLIFASPVQAGPVVAELYTSRNCPNCPPAERVLGQIAAQPGVIALACHVTYFNRLGSADAASLDLCTQRQSAYNKALGLGNRVYTPQMLVNGGVQLKGGDPVAVSNALDAGAAQNIGQIELVRPNPGILEIHLPDSSGTVRQPLKINLVGYRLHNAAVLNAVTMMRPVGTWTGQPQKILIPLLPGESADAFAVLAEDANGRIYAAGKIE